MKLGLFTPVFGSLNFDELLTALKCFPAIECVELGTGGWPGSSHIPVQDLLANPEQARTFRKRLADANLTISALSCHGNPVHPDTEVAKRDDSTLRDTMRLAEMLEVPVVITFSGCPGGSTQDRTPNWITAVWPPEFSKALEWQWQEQLIPYWTSATKFAQENGVRIALEAHPGFCVYNPETMLQLRAAAGSSLGINLDPSHLWWQGVDIPAAIDLLGDAIFHVHAKDVALNPQKIALNGVLDTKSYTRLRERSWNFRSVGSGHGELDWKAIVAALRLTDYDYVMSIEHEDALASIDEGLGSAINMLERVLLREPPVQAWWV